MTGFHTNQPRAEIDRLLAIRHKVAELKAEEAALRLTILNLPDGQYRAENGAIKITTRKTKSLDRAKVPAAILRDPAMWKTTTTRAVTLVRPPRPDADAPLSDLIDDD